MYLLQYDNIIIVGDFNTEIGEKSMNTLCERYSLSSLIKEPTCYKTPTYPSWVDLTLTNSPCSFQVSSIVETDLSNFHRMIVTVSKTTFQRLPPKIRNYRDYIDFDNGMFPACLSEEDLHKYIKQSCHNIEKVYKR